MKNGATLHHSIDHVFMLQEACIARGKIASTRFVHFTTTKKRQETSHLLPAHQTNAFCWMYAWDVTWPGKQEKGAASLST